LFQGFRASACHCLVYLLGNDQEMKRSILGLVACIHVLLLSGGRCTAQAPAASIVLHVDLSNAPRRQLHAHLEIPVSAGPLTLEYPQWIPGDHRPTGPIDNLAGLLIRANGQDLPWRRDDVDS
jgi:hypothetical protein